MDDAPYIYQLIGGEQVEVPGRFVLLDASTYSFELAGGFDPARTLIIDPDLAWSTYLGGSDEDRGRGIAVDADGNALVTGDTESSGWVSGGFDTSYNGGGDAFVAKIANAPPSLTTVATLTGGLEDQDYTITYAALAWAADEADPDGDPVSFRVEAVSSGTLTKSGVPVVPGTTLLGTGESLVWHPALNANGTLQAFTVKAWDGHAASATAVPVSVQATPVNDVPVADAQGVSTAEDTAKEITLTGGDGDPEVVQTLTFAIVTPPSHGTLSGFDPATGAVTYTPAPNYNGPDSFTFTATDDGSAGPPANLISGAATVSLTVTPVNDVPGFYGQLPSDPSVVLVGQASSFDFNATDVDPDALTYSLIFGPAWLSMDAATGVLSGTPNRRAHIGSGPVTVRVGDGLGGSDDYTFQLTVQGQVIALAAGLPNPQTKATFTDASRDQVTVNMLGKVGTIYLVRGIAPGQGGVYSNTTPGDLCAIEAEGTDAKTGIKLGVKGVVNGRVPGTSVGDIVVTGSLKGLTAKTTDLVGDLTGEGSLGRLWVDDVRGGLTITIGTWDNPRAATTLVFDQVSDLVILSAMPIKSLTATEWLDTDATPDQIVAPWIGTLTTKGRKADLKRGIVGLAGDFEASLDLDGTGDPRLTLGSAKIKGDLTNATWDITGNVGSITAGDADGWTLNVQSTLKSLKLNEVNATTISVDGSAGSLTMGRVTDTTVDITGALKSVKVADWDGGALEAGSLGSLKVTGSKKALLPGNFNADITLDMPVPKKPTLGSARIAGSVGDCEWQIAGDVGSVSVTGNFRGELHAQSVKSMTVKGNMDGATLDLTRGIDPLIPKLMALAKLSISGWVQNSVITTPGHIGSVTAGGMKNSSLFAGVVTTRDVLGVGGVSDDVFDLPSLTDLAPPEPVRGLVAGIKSVTIKGIKTGKLYGDSVINTNIAAGGLGRMTLCYATLDNDGNASATDVPFGLVSGTALTFRVSYKDADPTHKFAWKAGQLLPTWLGSADLKIENG